MKTLAALLLSATLIGCRTPVDNEDALLIPYNQVKNIPYEAEETNDVWKTPKQTLRDNAGDCEDKAFLYRYLRKRDYGEDTRIVYGVIMLKGMHAWDEVDYDNKKIWVDPTNGFMIDREDAFPILLEIVPYGKLKKKIDKYEADR